MLRQSSKPSTKFGAVMRVVLVIRTALLLAFSYSVPGWTQTFDVERLISTVPKVAGQTHLLLLQGEQNFHHFRLDYLRTLAETRKRVRGLSRTVANAPFLIEGKPAALSFPGQNVLLLGTEMLDLWGADSGMAATLLGKAYAQLDMKQSLRMVSNLRSFLHCSAAPGRGGRQRPRDRYAAADSARIAFFGVPAAPEQEVDAKKLFLDPTMGIRGDASVLNPQPGPSLWLAEPTREQESPPSGQMLSFRG